jgi:hypothetical protein
MRYGLLWQNWLCATGHCRKVGDVQWATAVNLVMRCGPLWRICLFAFLATAYNEAISHFAGFGCALWATAQELKMDYGPQHRILLCTMGRSAGFCYALWAMPRIWLCAKYHCAKPITIAQNRTIFFKKLAKSVKEQWGWKVNIYKKAYDIPVWKHWYLKKNFVPRNGP